MSFKRHYVVANFTLDSGPSGAWRRTLALLREMPALLEPGESVSLLTGTDTDVPDLPADVRVHRADIASRPTWRRVLAERRRLARVLDDLAADVLDLGTLPVPPGLRCPVVLTVHDARDLVGPFRRRAAWLSRLVLRSSLRRAASLIVPSAFTESALRKATGGLLPQVRVIGGGVDPRLLATEPQHGDGRRYFLHVGHLEPRKNLLLLLSAYAAFLEREGEPYSRLPRLVLAGRDLGAGAELAERTAMLDLAGHVEFRGAFRDATLPDLYAGAVALLMPSLHEGFGLPALEALAVGIPVAVANAGALPEVIGEFGSVLPPGDATAWSSVMAWHTQNPSTFDAIAARKQYAARQTWSVRAVQVLDCWRAASEQPAM
ncbi:MAG: glycosyltransferase family 1 protein [Planctomycetota bacterium]